MDCDIWGKAPPQNRDTAAYAELWRQRFTEASDLTAKVTVVKIQRHQSWAQPRVQGAAWWAWRRNREADR
eukprot:5800545-Pyramimonas_sp.AAC.1